MTYNRPQGSKLLKEANFVLQQHRLRGFVNRAMP